MRPAALAALAVLAALIGATLLWPERAAAHPLGNFTISRYSRIELTTGEVRLRYVIDMAEIPTFQEKAAIDRDRDGAISDAEAAAYADRQVDVLLDNLALQINGKAVALRPADRAISFPEGQGGLPTLRLALWYAGDLPEVSGRWQAEFKDGNYADRLGWKEIIVRAGPGIELAESSAGAIDVSNELQSYPEDLLQAPLNQREARFSFQPGVGVELTPLGSEPARAKQPDRFARLIQRDLSLPVVLLSLLIAMGLGALHALGPGHGKTVVAAYLVGSRGTTKHAIFLGLTVTLTHTSSVFLLGLVTLYLSRYILPETLYPWLSLISGLSIVLLGVVLFGGRLRTLLRRRRAPRRPFAPAPAAHSRARNYQPEVGQGHGHAGMDAFQTHAHGGRAHSHLPPGADGDRITWRSLLALGVAGGILPCPSALVVLLTAISLHRVGYGMLLIFAFSVGLAGVLTGIGLLLVHARGLFSRLPTDGLIARAVPVLSALVVTALGAGIALRAVGQM